MLESPFESPELSHPEGSTIEAIGAALDWRRRFPKLLVLRYNAHRHVPGATFKELLLLMLAFPNVSEFNLADISPPLSLQTTLVPSVVTREILDGATAVLRAMTDGLLLKHRPQAGQNDQSLAGAD